MSKLPTWDELPAELDCPYRRFWSAVLMTNIEDALGNVRGLSGNAPNTKNLDIHRAEGWLGSRDFDLVCLYAGKDPDAIRERLGPIIAMPVKERLKWWRKRMSAANRGIKSESGICAMNGCDAAVWKYSKTGLCRRHIHAPGVCECGDCRRKGRGRWAV